MKHRSLLVIARGSTFAFKGQAVDARRAGLDLGADYAVEGRVVRSGQRLRISARLVETEAGRHVWAERYDRSRIPPNWSFTSKGSSRLGYQRSGCAGQSANALVRQSLSTGGMVHG